MSDMEDPLRPLIRWPGGKRWLLARLKQLIPSSYGTYVEPFLGGGALFFGVRPSTAALSDINRDLIGAYEVLRDDPVGLGSALRALSRDEAGYYRVRSSSPSSVVDAAARVIYLSTLAFNGIYRVNRRGEFNVPYGHRRYDDAWPDEKLMAYSEALGHATLRVTDFESPLAEAQAGDFVYLDPPYTVAHSNNGFRRYNESIFSWEDQERLARAATAAAERGCAVVISSASHASIRELYPGFREIVIPRRSLIASKASARQSTEELIFTNVG